MQGKVQYGSWFKHVSEWRNHQDHPNIMFIRYEDLILNLPVTIDRIIHFCGFHVDKERMSDILKKCSFSFMKQHENMFDYINETKWEKECSQKLDVRKGQNTQARQLLNQEQEKQFEKEWGKYF